MDALHLVGVHVPRVVPRHVGFATRLSILLVAVAAIGTAVTILLATDTTWTTVTVSHLSADPVAGPLFRGTMLACGLLVLCVAAATWAPIGRLARRGMAGRRWVNVHRTCLLAAGCGLLGVGGFPLEVSLLVDLAHGVTAYAVALALIVLMLTARPTVPPLGDAFGRTSLGALAFILLLYVTALFGLMAYAPMELLAFGIGGAWLLGYVDRLERLARVEHARSAGILPAVVHGDAIRLEPATVRSGDVYLVLDVPGTDVLMIESMVSAEATAGPLTDEELARVARGDTFHTSITAGSANGEPYGNVSKLSLAPGQYAFLADAPELLAARSGGSIPAEKMAVLLVLP